MRAQVHHAHLRNTLHTQLKQRQSKLAIRVSKPIPGYSKQTVPNQEGDDVLLLVGAPPDRVDGATQEARGPDQVP
jgi:hypothetical protein